MSRMGIISRCLPRITGARIVPLKDHKEINTVCVGRDKVPAKQGIGSTAHFASGNLGVLPIRHYDILANNIATQTTVLGGLRAQYVRTSHQSKCPQSRPMNNYVGHDKLIIGLGFSPAALLPTCKRFGGSKPPPYV